MNANLRVWNLAIDLLFGRDDGQLGPAFERAAGTIPDFWPALISLANASLVTAPLWKALRRHGLAASVPENAAEYLQSFHAFNTARNEALLAQLLECIAALNRCGVVPMPIKGAAYLASDLYEHIGDRFFADIDLMVPPGSVDEACHAMRELGYAEAAEPDFDYTHHHHLAPFAREGEPAAIELHLRSVPAHAEPALPSSGLWADAVPTSIGHARCVLPSATDAAMLCFLHTEIVDRNLLLYFVPLRPFFDMALLVDRHGARIDWQANFRRAETIGAATRLTTFLHVFHKMSPQSSVSWPRFSRSTAAHFSLCQAAIAWPAISRWMLRLERLSDSRLRERYGVAGGVAALNRYRLRELGSMLSRSVKH